MFEEVVHNFGKSDGDIIQPKNACLQQMHTWFHAQLDQKICDGLQASSFTVATVLQSAYSKNGTLIFSADLNVDSDFEVLKICSICHFEGYYS